MKKLFTHVWCRYSAVTKLLSARAAAETVATHQLTDSDAVCSSPVTLSAGGSDGAACSRGMSLIALSMWQRLLDGLQSFVGLQSASHRSYSLIN